jgi:hypothetical protein
MPNLPFEVNENYNDGGVWYNKYQSIRQTTHKRMAIPLERPESPNVRLAQAGINGSSFQSNVRLNENTIGHIPTPSLPANYNMSYGADRAIAQGMQVPMNQIKMLTEGPPTQFSQPMMQQSQWQEVNPATRLMQQQMAQQQAYNTMGAPPPPQQQQVVRLWEGADFYRPVETGGFGGMTILCRAGGRVPANWAVDFEARGIRSCYIVPLNETRVDMAKIQSNPQLLTQLVEVRSPMIGVILVPQQAIMNQQFTQPRQVLRDQVMRPQQPMLPNNNSVYGRYQAPMMPQQQQPQQRSRILMG